MSPAVRVQTLPREIGPPRAPVGLVSRRFSSRPGEGRCLLSSPAARPAADSSRRRSPLAHSRCQPPIRGAPGSLSRRGAARLRASHRCSELVERGIALRQSSGDARRRSRIKLACDRRLVVVSRPLSKRKRGRQGLAPSPVDQPASGLLPTGPRCCRRLDCWAVLVAEHGFPNEARAAQRGLGTSHAPVARLRAGARGERDHGRSRAQRPSLQPSRLPPRITSLFRQPLASLISSARGERAHMLSKV